ncbi:MAG: hypothetical protein ACTTIS_00300 [Streptobacillus sp.]
MLLSIKLKPIKYTSNSRSEILRNITNGSLSLNAVGAPLDCQGNYIVYSIQKIRGHWEYTYYKNGNVKSGKYVPTSYIGYKYIIHPTLLVMTGMKIVRTKTGFKLVKAK